MITAFTDFLHKRQTVMNITLLLFNKQLHKTHSIINMLQQNIVTYDLEITQTPYKVQRNQLKFIIIFNIK